jgi:hypothetical protein
VSDSRRIASSSLGCVRWTAFGLWALPGCLAAVGLAFGPAVVAGGPEGRVVDAAVAEIGGAVVTASDVALARALGLFGLTPTRGPITAAEVERHVEGLLLAAEAARLAIEVTAEDMERAWQAALGGGREPWLEARGIERAWARRLVEADVRRRHFAEARFRAFAFVTESDVAAALGPGSHGEAARREARERLEAERVAREIEAWRQDAITRLAVRRVWPGPGPAPDPLDAPGIRQSP